MRGDELGLQCRGRRRRPGDGNGQVTRFEVGGGPGEERDEQGLKRDDGDGEDQTEAEWT
jgi:hypothetical protein